MAVLAYENLNKALVRQYTVVALGSTTLGYSVKLDTVETTVTVGAAVTDDCIGIALDTAVAGAGVRVAMWGNGIAKGKVGTGAASFGAPLKWVADGLTDATVGGGTVKQVILGQALQSGVAADLIGVNLGGFSWSVSA